MIRFGFLILTLSVCWEFVSTQKPCDGVLGQQFRPDPTDCRVYYLCGQGKDWRLQCGPNMIWNQEKGACVFSTPKDTCTQNIKNPLPPKPPQGDPNARSPGSRHYSPFSESTWRPKCRPGSTKRFPHPTRCAQYYDCGADPKEDWWGKHLRECRYPTVYDTKTGSCEYYTTVNCGKRKMPLDPCDYLSNACRNAHCAPCHIRYATCTGLPDGINVWRGREKTPFYVVCQKERVAFHGRCINTEPGKRQVYDGEYHTCGRPIDFEMGMVHHMHRGEIGKSQIVEQIHHAKRVQQSQQFKAPQHSKSPSNPVQKNKQNNTNNNAGKKQTQQGNKKHINQPKKNQTPQQNVKVQNANNNQPQNQPNTPKPHINQPQQKAAPSQKKAVQKQPNSHAPHVNQPKIPPPQGNTQSPSKNTIHPNQAQPQTPGQSARHANKPQTQAPVQNSPPSRQQYQSPPQSQKPPQHPPNTFKPSSQPQQHNPSQRPLQNHAPPNNQHPSQQYSHPNRQHNSPQPPPQNYGPPNRSPQPQYPQHQRPGSNIATQPHVNQPPASTQQQGPPYSHPPNQNKVPAQTPTSLQTFIGEMQNKFMNQQPNVPQPHVYPNHPNQPLHNAPSQHPSANNPPVPYQQTVRAKPGRRPQRTHNTPPVQPVQPLPRQPVVHQRAPVVHQPLPVVHQPAPTRQVSYPHPNQQRQPSYPQAPQVKPLPPVPQRPPTVPRNPRPPQNVRRTVQNPNIPRTSPYHNSQPSYPIPNKNHSPPQPTPTQSRAYPQPLPRARNHGPQPVQRPRIGPYPKPQLYNEPSTTRQAIGRKNLSRRRHPKPTNQVGRAFRNEPFRREVVVSDAKREKIVDIKSSHVPAQQSIHSKPERAMERYSSHILGLNEIFKSNGNQQSKSEKQTAKRTEETFRHLNYHKQQKESNQKQNKNQQQQPQQQSHHPNQPNYQQQHQQQQQQNTVRQQIQNHQSQPSQKQTPQNVQNQQVQQQHSQNSPNQFQQPQSNNHGFQLQASQLSNIAQHQQFQQQAMRQIMRVNPTPQFINPRFQTHQNAVGNSHYLQPPTPTVLSNYFPASTARTAVLNSRFTIQSGLAASRLSQSGGPKFSNSLSNPSQFAMPNVV